MSLFNKLTIFSILILMAAFVAVPTMAHDIITTGTDHEDDAHTAGDDLTLRAQTPAVVHATHPVVTNITLDGAASDGYVKANQTFNMTITFASGTVPTDLTEDDITLPTGWTMGNLRKSGSTWIASITTIGTTSDVFTAGVPDTGSVIMITGSAEATVSGADAATVIYVPPNADGDDADTDPDTGYAADKANSAKGVLVFDVDVPVVSAIVVEQVEAGGRGLPVDPNTPLSRDLEVTFTIEENTGHAGIDFSTLRDGMAFKASYTPEGDDAEEEDKMDLMLEFTDFGLAQDDTDNTKYAVTVKQNRGTTAIMEKDGVTITITVKDKADNNSEPASSEPLHLASRTATEPDTGPDDTDATPPTVTITEKAGTGDDDGKVIFTFTFDDDLITAGEYAFTLADIDIGNSSTSVAATLMTSDNKVFTLKVTPENEDFPVKVTIKSDAKVRDTSNNAMATGENGLGATKTHTPPGVLGVEIDAPAALEFGVLTFTFTFAQAPAAALDDNDMPQAGAFTIADIQVENGEKLVEADLRQPIPEDLTATEVVYELDVTPIDPTKPVKVQLRPRSVSNEDGTLVAGQISATYTPPVPDTTAPIVTITAPTRVGASNALVFTIDFDEALFAPLTVGDLTIGGADASMAIFTSVTTGLPTGVAMRYTLTVTGTPGTPVTVNLKAERVMDVAENKVVPLTTAASFTIPLPAGDTTPPVVTIMKPNAPVASGTNMGKLIFTYTVTDNESALKDDHIAEQDVEVRGGTFVIVGDQIIVTPASATTKVTVTIKSAAASNVNATHNLSEETSMSFTPAGYIPTITITGADSADKKKIIFTFDFSERVAVNSFSVSDISTTNTPVLKLGDLMPVMGTTAAPLPDDVAARYKLTVTPTNAANAVTVTIRAGAVMTTDTPPKQFDSATDSHTLTQPKTPVTPDPVDPNASPEITIGVGEFLVVVRSETGEMGRLLKAYNPNIKLAAWSTMPDLQNVFETGVPLIGSAHGGGALILKQSGTTVVNPGTVGISEIMWAIDESQLNNAEERKADQWIELHNLNTTAVTVKLTWKTGAKAIAADTSINGNLDRPYIDVVTNVFHDRPGNAHWVVPGQNGNPVIGKNFVSAARKGTFSLTSKHDNKFNKRYTRSDKQENASNSPDGRNKDQWEASSVRYANRTDTITTNDGRSFNVAYEDHGTPGRENSFSPPRADTRVARTAVPFNSVVFNEIANRTNEDYEWIELRNTTDGEINLKNYLISIVEDKPAAADRDKPNNDKIFYQFPSNDNAKIAAKGVFLLVASDPRGDDDHPLATGYNVDIDEEDQIVGSRKNPVKYKVMRKSDQQAYQYENLGLPDDGKFILILRRPDGPQGHRSGAHGGEGVAERGKDDLDKIVDIAGYHPNSNDENLRMSNYPNAVSSTNLWPLRNFEPLDFNRNQLSSETVHHRTALSSRGSHNDHRAAWQDAAYTGVGYKRQASDSAVHGGSPGYHGNTTGLSADNKVIISEIMLSQGTRGNLPQWIELYNPSKTHAVNLADNVGWRLVIENPDRAPIITINFKDDGNVKVIPPNQTVLIVSSSARDYGSDNLPRGTVFPNTRVLNAFTAIRGETFELASRTSPLLDPAGFNVRLMDGKTSNNKTDGRYIGEISDEIGNLDGNIRTTDAPAWELPSGMAEDGSRTSLVRRFIDGMPQDGMMASSWTRAVDTDGYAQLYVRHTWYGDETDYGTPADRTGSVLPVRLSFFRPTLEDGKVVIRWTTESELDNAGFNILRSQDRNGEFTKVNDQLIQGKGTTAERSTYKWVDTSAKPGAVYYYQIEDVSFAGERQTLTTTKMKGLISAKNKLTTKWGELKEVQ